MPRTVKVQFWQFVNPTTAEPLPGIFPGTTLVTHLGSALTADSLVRFGDQYEVAAHTTRADNPRAFVFYTVRRQDIPAVLRRNLTVEDLPLLQDEGLVEPTHIVLFGRNVVGVLYNHYGPRPSRIAAYLRTRFKLDVDLRAVIRPNIVRLLNQMSEITAIEFSLPVNRPLAAQGTRYGRALRTLQNASPSKVIHIRETIRGSSEPNAGQQIRSFIDDDVIAGGELDNYSSFKVRGKGPGFEIQTIDLVQQMLAVTRDVDTAAGTHNIAPPSARTAIQSAHEQMRQEINRSVPELSPNERLTFADLEFS